MARAMRDGEVLAESTDTQVVEGNHHFPAATWTYREPKPAAAAIAGHIAFWKGVEVEA